MTSSRNVSPQGREAAETTFAQSQVVTPDCPPSHVVGPPSGHITFPDISSFEMNEKRDQKPTLLRPRPMGAGAASIGFPSQEYMKRQLTLRRLEMLRLEEELCLTEMAELRCLDEIRAMEEIRARAYKEGRVKPLQPNQSNPLLQTRNGMAACPLPYNLQGPDNFQVRRQSPQIMSHKMAQAQMAQAPMISAKMQMWLPFQTPPQAPWIAKGCSSTASVSPTPSKAGFLAARIDRSRAVLGASRAAVAAAKLESDLRAQEDQSREAHATAERAMAALEGKMEHAKVAEAGGNETKSPETFMIQKETDEIEAAKEILRLGDTSPPPERHVGTNLGNRKRKCSEADMQTLYPQVLWTPSVDNPPNDKKATSPRRPLSAYNLFFSEERVRILQALEEISSSDYDEDGLPNPQKLEEVLSRQEKENKDHLGPSTASATLMRDHAAPRSAKKPRRPHRRTHGRIGFTQLAKLVGRRWKSLPPERTQRYRELAQKDLERYRCAMAEESIKRKAMGAI